jgi:hypothetical protein
MNDKPVTVTFLVGGLLWALWHWRRARGVGTPAPARLTDSPIQPAPFDAGARLSGLSA